MAWSSAPISRSAAGIELLSELGAALPDEPDEACRTLLDRALADGNAHDDVALLIARLDAPPLNLDLVVRAEPGSLVGVRRALGRWLRAAGVGDAEAYEIQVACGEACTNAITHAYPPGKPTSRSARAVTGTSWRSRWRTSAPGGRREADPAAAAWR